mmetsp:Transcript_17955/g.36472  ORF Transcript_17955/g.36472 Transcript_17955/m.36472 type:complete len:214 (-) Transcript_17955:516-1157(-)
MALVHTGQFGFCSYTNVCEYTPSLPMYIIYVLSVCEPNVTILRHSLTQAAATTAFVEATAGMMFLTTPIVSMYVTPLILYLLALSRARSYTHFMSSGLSLSSFLSGKTLGHSSMKAYEMQCSGSLGVSAMVHMGKVFWGGKASREHSKQDVILGMMTRAWPRKPSVPPSMMGMIVSGSGSPSSSTATRETIMALSQRRASTLSRPEMMTLKPL